MAAIQRNLSVPPIEMSASIECMQEDAKAVQRTVRGFQDKLAIHEAHALLAKGSTAIAEVLEAWDPQGLKAIAVAATAAQPDAVVVLFTSTSPAQVVLARGANSKVDAAALLKQLTATFGGKGGGKPDLAQGGGLIGSSQLLIEGARALLNSNS